MTPIDEVLAEFVAELLKFYYKENSPYGKRFIHPPERLAEIVSLAKGNDNPVINVKEKLPALLFNSEILSPIIRHLIEEEMEKRGYKVSMSPQDRKYGHFYTIRKYSICVAGPYNPSKTKAVALAAFRTGER